MTTDTSADRRAQQPFRGTLRTDHSTRESSGLVQNLLGALAVVAVVAALACAVFFGYRAYQAYFVDRPIQQARDESVAAAEQAMLNVTSIDPTKLDDWKRRIDASLTGQALEQVTQQDYGNLTQMVQQSNGQAATLTSRLKRSAPTEVNADAGQAKVLVYVDATSKRENEGGVTQTMGFLVTMTRVEGGQWKASGINSLDSIQYTPTEGGGTGGAAPAPQQPGAQQPAPQQSPAPAPQQPAPQPAPQQPQAPAPGGGN